MLSRWSFAFLSIILCEISAFANLSLTPQRIELNNSNRMQSVLLINEAKEVVTYRLGFRYQSMDSSGGLQAVTPEEEKLMKPIEQMVMFSPKQVTLQPNKTQTVKFTFRNISTATLDEYNSFIVFQELDNSPKIPQLSDQPAEGEVAIKVKPLFKISIPIFVSNANNTTQSTAEIANLKIDKDLNVLTFDVNNTGKYSLTGRVVAKFFKDKKLLGEFEQKGITMFNPLKTRQVLMTYDELKFQDSQATSVEITYLPPVGKKEYIIGQAKLELNTVTK